MNKKKYTLSEVLKEQKIGEFTLGPENMDFVRTIDKYIINPSDPEIQNTLPVKLYKSVYALIADIYLRFNEDEYHDYDERKFTILKAGWTALKNYNLMIGKEL